MIAARSPAGLYGRHKLRSDRGLTVRRRLGLIDLFEQAGEVEGDGDVRGTGVGADRRRYPLQPVEQGVAVNVERLGRLGQPQAMVDEGDDRAPQVRPATLRGQIAERRP